MRVVLLAGAFFLGGGGPNGAAQEGNTGKDAGVAAKDTPRLFDWIPCGYADLSGTGTQPQDFSTPCTLAGADQDTLAEVRPPAVAETFVTAPGTAVGV